MAGLGRAQPSFLLPAHRCRPPAPVPSRGRRVQAWRAGAALAAALALAGCATQQQILEGQEGLLAAAGFVARPANTAERQQMLAALPPGRIVQRPDGDQISYLFADPLDCRCLYVGGPQAWTQYQRMLQQQRLADAQVEAAQLNYGAFSWGPWGGFGPGF